MTGKLLWWSLFSSVLIWSGIAPKDGLTWFLEVLPALIGGAFIAWSYRALPLTPLLQTLILIHCIILMIGGHYTYAEVPFFDWLRDAFDMQRNNYDKLGHFAQGFVPAILAREILIQKQVLSSPVWRNYFILCICLSFSAFYELIEWWVALLSSEAADAFLGTQGYIWDTQSDMLWALCGAIAALLTLSKLHSRQLSGLSPRGAR